MPTTLQDTRTPGWFWIEDAVIDRFGPHIGAIGVAVYAYLARRADKQGICFPSYQTVARQLNLSRRTVITYISLLEQHRLIVAASRSAGSKARSTNAYRLADLHQPDGLGKGGAAGSPPPAANGHPTGATPALVQQVHQGGAADSPG